MADDRIARRLRELLSYQSGVPEESLDASSTPLNTVGWDSVANLGFMAAIEEEFKVTIATRDAVRLRSLGDIEVYLRGHVGPGQGG
jgi:acyl carrier protein